MAKFGRLVDGVLQMAPRVLTEPGRMVSNPGETDYRVAGWLPVEEVREVEGGKWTMEGDASLSEAGSSHDRNVAAALAPFGEGKARAAVGGERVRVGWEEADGVIRGVYEVRTVSPVIPLSKEKICRKVDELGLTGAFFGWLQSSAEIFCGWTAAGEVLAYDPGAHDGILAGLLGVLGVTPEEAVGIIEELRV